MRTTNCWLLPVLFTTAFCSQAVCATALQISTETAPAGGWAQIKIYAAKPAAISTGELVLALDPTVFSNGALVGLFGANADALGAATVTWPQIDVKFTSPTGGIGQLAGVPIMVISVPVLASAAGKTVAITATSPDSSMTVASGSVTVSGTLSVEQIPAGMGAFATVVPIYGTGFTPSTTVTIDGAAISAVDFKSAEEIDVTLAGPTELVGKLARVTDSGVEFDYFCFQPNGPTSPGTGVFGTAVANVQPLFPLFASTGFTTYDGYIGGVLEVENPNQSAATVTITNGDNGGGPAITESQQSLSIPPGSWAILNGGPDNSSSLTSNLPVRLVPLRFCSAGVGLPVCLGTATPFDNAAQSATAPSMTPSSLAFAWQIGTAAPGARTVVVTEPYYTPVVVTTTTTSGQNWLSASTSTPSFPSPFTVSVSVDPSQLIAGTYQGSIVLTPGDGTAATFPVALTVTAAPVPMISEAPASLNFSAPDFNSTPYSGTIAVTSDSGPTPFSVTLQPGTWVKVSPVSGTTPATLLVTWDPAVTSQINFQQRSTAASISISGPGNTITVPATFNVTGVQTFQTYLGVSGTGPNGLSFSAQTGSASQTATINVDPPGTISATANQPWITLGALTNASLSVTVNPSGLAPGVYSGAVTVGEPGLPSIAVPVTLGVWTTPPPLTLSTSSFTFVQIVGEAPPPNRLAQVASAGVPVPLTILNGTSWLNVVDFYNALAPTSILVGLIQEPASPGEYDGSFTLQSPGRSVYAPVTLLVEPGPAALPVLSQVVNAASGIPAAVSPGEIVTVRGYSTGASAVSGLKFDAAGKAATTLSGVEVTFDGKPAPLLYTSANQTNLIVPYEVAAQTSTVLQIVYATAAGTVQTASWTLPVLAAAPAIFTLDATGTGPGAIVNQDGSVNNSTNPAARGSVISIYATGEGQTSPAGVTGSVAQSTKAPLLPVTVTIGGIAATMQYAGSAPGEVSGLLQVNAVVPPGIAPGLATPITLNIGGIVSQPGVTIAVK